MVKPNKKQNAVRSCLVWCCSNAHPKIKHRENQNTKTFLFVLSNGYCKLDKNMGPIRFGILEH